MDNKNKTKKTKKSFDLISKEMAEIIVNDRKNKIELDIEKDIIKFEKKKKKKEVQLKKQNELFQNKNKSFESEQLNTNINKSIKRPKYNNDLRNYDEQNIVENKNNNNKETPMKIVSKSKFVNNNDKNNPEQTKDNNEKEDIEITISPYYEYNEDSIDHGINYYNIRYYIDRKKLSEKNKINRKHSSTIHKSSSFKNLNYIRKEGLSSSQIKNIKRNKNKKKNEYSFLFEEQQQNDSDDWGNYVNNLSFKKNQEKVFLYEPRNNTTLNSNKDSSSYFDIDEHDNSGEKIVKNNNNKIYDYFVDYKKNKQGFFEKQLNRKRLTEIKLNRKKERIKSFEDRNNYYSPMINEVSLQIVRNKGDYIPLFERAVELQNEKKIKILLKQKIQNQSYSVNNSKLKKRSQKQINDFFNSQMDWKNKVEEKNNILKLELKEKENQKTTEINLTPRFSNNSLNIHTKKIKQANSFTLYDNNRYKNTTYSMYLKKINETNIGYRLYKDFEKRQKNLNRLKKKLTPSFTPMINKHNISFHGSRNNSSNIKKRNINNNSEQNKKILIYEFDSSYKNKQQKSRNPKKVNRYKSSTSDSSSNYFKIKELNNNFISTAVESRNSKSRPTLDIFGTKLEKIKEFKDQDEDHSSSDYSLSNNSIKKTNKKVYIKNNKNSKTIDQEQKFDTIKSKSNFINNTYNISEEKTLSKVDHSTNKSWTTEINKINKEDKELKNYTRYKYSNQKSLNSQDSYNFNLNLDDNKNIIDNIEKSTKQDNQTPNIGKKIEKINLDINSNITKKTIEIKEFNNEQIKPIIIKKDINDENKKSNRNSSMNSNISSNIISNINSNINSNMNSNKNSNKNSNNNSNIENNINNNNIKINSFKKFFSKNSVKENSPKKNSIIRDKIKSKSITLQSQSNSVFTNKNNLENTIKNPLDSTETNNNIYNLDLNSSQNSFKNEKIEVNSSFNLENQIEPSQNNNSTNVQRKREKKKTEKEILKQYKFDESQKDEDESEEEENEESDKKSDVSDKENKENKEENFSWIKKLNEIAGNEGYKNERNNKKRKTGGSTTRTQTKRKYDKNNNLYICFDSNKKTIDNFGENKLYMLNLRSSSSNGYLNPYTIVAKDPLFYKFFLKNSKHK